nr:MAG TPA: hypothetical protein [Caudoviricetes sp.]
MHIKGASGVFLLLFPLSRLYLKSHRQPGGSWLMIRFYSIIILIFRY